MKSSQIRSCAVLFNLSLLAACGGTSSIGSSDALGAGGSKTGGMMSAGSNAKGGSGAMDSMGTGEAGAAAGTTGGMAPSQAGAGSVVMPGTAGASSSAECKVDLDCLGVGEGCSPCTGGGFACNNYCVGGKCVTEPGGCPTTCSSDNDCTEKSCINCDGSKTCAQSTCLMGTCQTSTPVCNTTTCMGLACGTPCAVCAADGLCQTGSSFCDDAGQCQTGTPQCGAATCMTAMDCGTPPPNCVPCTDGSCAGFECIANKCIVECAPSTTPQCNSTEDCPMPEGACTMCPSGKCAVQACIQNSCALVCPLM